MRSLNAFISILAASMAMLPGTAAAQGPLPPLSQAPLAPLYEAVAEQSTDHFYTIDLNEYNAAITIHGFQPSGVVAYIEAGPAPNTSQFRRFYSASRTDHFYTTDPGEANHVLNFGWTEEQGEGFIYTAQMPGSAPLYRLSKAWPSGDHDHIYTMLGSRVQELQLQGYVLDGTAGYAYSSPMPTVSNGIVMGYRPWLAGSGRQKLFGLLYLPDTNRPPNATTQVVNFNVRQFGMVAGGDHLAIILRSRFREDAFWPQNNFYYWGAGLAYGNLSSFCWNTDYVAVLENFGPPAQTVWGDNRQPGSTCSPNLNQGAIYNVTVTVSDSAIMSYLIMTQGTFVAAGMKDVSDIPGFSGKNPFMLQDSGLLIFHTDFAARSPAAQHIPSTVYVENLQTWWY